MFSQIPIRFHYLNSFNFHIIFQRWDLKPWFFTKHLLIYLCHVKALSMNAAGEYQDILMQLSVPTSFHLKPKRPEKQLTMVVPVHWSILVLTTTKLPLKLGKAYFISYAVDSAFRPLNIWKYLNSMEEKWDIFYVKWSLNTEVSDTENLVKFRKFCGLFEKILTLLYFENVWVEVKCAMLMNF